MKLIFYCKVKNKKYKINSVILYITVSTIFKLQNDFQNNTENFMKNNNVIFYLYYCNLTSDI